MSITVEQEAYRSPQKKLIRFFARSRDGWKRKCQTAKTSVKRLVNGTHALKKSRDRWKTLAKQSQDEVRQLRRELEVQKASCL